MPNLYCACTLTSENLIAKPPTIFDVVCDGAAMRAPGSLAVLTSVEVWRGDRLVGRGLDRGVVVCNCAVEIIRILALYGAASA